MKIVVGTKNPIKLAAVEEGFRRMFDGVDPIIVGAKVASGVSDQPGSSKETYQGAFNRASNCFDQYKEEADFFVGLEGGIEEFENGEMGCLGWVVVMSKDGKVGRGSGGFHILPPKVCELLKQGMELGDADDIVFQDSNSKQKMGSIGILTKGVLDRKSSFIEPIIKALIPHKNPELY